MTPHNTASHSTVRRALMVPDLATNIGDRDRDRDIDWDRDGQGPDAPPYNLFIVVHHLTKTTTIVHIPKHKPTLTLQR